MRIYSLAWTDFYSYVYMVPFCYGSPFVVIIIIIVERLLCVAIKNKNKNNNKTNTTLRRIPKCSNEAISPNIRT